MRRQGEQAAGRASPAQRTKVIILAEVVAIVALLVLWSLLRSRCAVPVDQA